MIPNRMRVIHTKGLTPLQTTKTSIFGVQLSRTNGLGSVCIRGGQSYKIVDGIKRISYTGEPGEDGRFHFPLRQHADNFFGGEELAESMLAAAQTNSALTVSVHDGVLYFKNEGSTVNFVFKNQLFLQTFEEEYYIKFSMRVQGFSGSYLETGLAICYDSNTRSSVTKSGTFREGETYEVSSSVGFLKTIVGLAVLPTAGRTHEIDLNRFGIFRSSNANYSLYRGNRYSFSLKAPLFSFNFMHDEAYPMQGYARRFVGNRDFSANSVTLTDHGVKHPIYLVELPTDLQGKKTELNRFSTATSLTVLKNGTGYTFPSEDGKGHYFSVKADTDTPEKFCTLWNSLGVQLFYQLEEEQIERFDPITIHSWAGWNYLRITTDVNASSMKFIYI